MKHGVNDTRRVPCSRSKDHGFHPANEDCAWCCPKEQVAKLNEAIQLFWDRFAKKAASPARPSNLPPQHPHRYLDVAVGLALDNAAPSSIRRMAGETDEHFRWRIKDSWGYTIK